MQWGMNDAPLPPPAPAPPAERAPDGDLADERIPGEAAVWVGGCVVAAAFVLGAGVWLAYWMTMLANDFGGWGGWGSRRELSFGGAEAWAPLAGLVLFAGWLAWRSRGRIGEAGRSAGTAAKWAGAGAAAFLAVTLWTALTAERSPPLGPPALALLLAGPALGAGLVAWTAAACGPPVDRRPIVQTAGWVAACVGAVLLAFGPAVWQTLRDAPPVPGVPREFLALGGVLLVLTTGLTAAIVWRHDPGAHDRLARWGQVGAAGFAATGAVLGPFLAALFGESARGDAEPAWFFTAFVLLPALGCGVAALAGRWADRQSEPL